MLIDTARSIVLFFTLVVFVFGCSGGGGGDGDPVDNNSGKYIVGGQPIEENPPETSSENSAPQVLDFSIIPSTIDSGSQVSFKLTFSDTEGDVIKCLIDFSNQPNKYYLYDTSANTNGYKNYQLTITDSVYINTPGSYSVRIAVQDEAGNTSNYISSTLIVKGEGKKLEGFYFLIDDYHDTDGDSLSGNLSGMKQAVESNGGVITAITSEINTGTLSSGDVLILYDYESAFSTNEIASILNWLQQGGRLLAVGASRFSNDGGASLDSILKPHGISFGAEIASNVLNTFASHDITKEVNSLSVGEDFTIINGGTAIGSYNGSVGLVYTTNSPRIIAIGSSKILENSYFGTRDEATFLINSLSWLTEELGGNGTFCTDVDADGYYAQNGCGTTVDCNDNDTNMNPGASEVCGDGKDNDCDGQIDEDCGTSSSPSVIVDGQKLALVAQDTYSYADGYRRRFGFRSENDSLIIALANYTGTGVYLDANSSTSKYSQGYFYKGCTGRSDDEYFCDNPEMIYVIMSGQMEITKDSQNSFSGTFQFTLEHNASGSTINITGSFTDLQPTGSWQY